MSLNVPSVEQLVGHLGSSWYTLKLEFLKDYTFINMADILCVFGIWGEDGRYKISAKSARPFLRYGCPTFSSVVRQIVLLTVSEKKSNYSRSMEEPK